MPGSFALTTNSLVGGYVLTTYGKKAKTYFPRICFIPSISGISVTSANKTNFEYDINANQSTQTFSYKRHITTDESGVSSGQIPQFINFNHALFRQYSLGQFMHDIVNTAPANIGNGQGYNYALPVSDRTDNCTVQAGGWLGINTNEEAGGTGDTYNNNLPVANSTYRVETINKTATCAATAITITVHGDLELGSSTNNLSGDLVVRTGSKLILQNNSTLNLYNNSKLIIQQGAELEIEGSVNILLNNPGSIIDLKGTLKIEDNTVVNVTGEGSINFDCPNENYCNVNIDAGSTINLTGEGRAIKMVTVTGKGIDLTNLEELNITTAKVELGTNSEVVIGGSLELNAVRVSKTTGTAGNHIHKGLEINSPTGKTIAIDNCIFEYGIKGLTKTASSSLTQLVIENTTFTNCSLGLKTNECRCNLVNVRFDNCVTGWKAEDMSGSSDFRGYVQSVDNGIDYEGGSTAHLFIYESTFKTCTAQAILADGDFNTTFSCTHFEDNDNDIKKIDGVLNLSGSEYSENRFASSPEVGGSCYFHNTLNNTIDLSNVDFYIYDGNNDFDYPDAEVPTPPEEPNNRIFNGTITSNTTTLALGGNHWNFSNFSPADDLPNGLFDIYITVTDKFETATKLSSPSGCLSAWNGVQEYVERQHKPRSTVLNKENSSYTIYPNPAANQLFIKVSNGSLYANQSVKAIDMMGRTITLNTLSHDSTTQSYDISQLAVGMYQIIVEQNGHILHKQKLVVSR